MMYVILEKFSDDVTFISYTSQTRNIYLSTLVVMYMYEANALCFVVPFR